MRVGDKVEVLVGEWKGHKGEVVGLHREYPYPISVQFSDGDVNNFKEEELKTLYDKGE